VLREAESSGKTPKTLTRPTDSVFADYQTTSSQYNAVVGGLPTNCKYNGPYLMLLSIIKEKIRSKFENYWCRYCSCSIVS